MQTKEIQNRLAENLKRIRKSQKLTQFQLAEMIGMSEETIKNVELSRAWPSEKTLSQISEALNIDVCHLFMPISASFNVPQHFQESIKQVISMTYKNFVESALTEVINDKSDI
jgi:transcriptional regulator with XRE-family HTH domain